jgi:hypothetical protein
MRLGRYRFENKSLLVGMAATIALMVIPKVSEPLIKIVSDLREKIGGKK